MAALPFSPTSRRTSQPRYGRKKGPTMSKISLPVSPQASDGERRILSGRVKLDQLGLINESSARST